MKENMAKIHNPSYHGSKISPMAFQFLMKEYDVLRKQIDLYNKELLSAERWNLIVSAAVWSWLATSTKSNLPELIFWLPSIFTFVLGLRYLGLHITSLMTAYYISEIEMKMELPSEFGWETRLKKKRPWIMEIGGYAYWTVVLIINMMIPLYYIPTLPTR